MLSPPPKPEAGRRLKALRCGLRLSTREVERLSQQLAGAKGNQEYYISHGWLAELEKALFTPSVYKMYSLSVIYRCSLDDILAVFGICIGDVGKEQMSVVPPSTHLVGIRPDAGAAITVPLELRDKVLLERTNLISRMFERWGELPVTILQQMDLRNSLYGYIGMEDYTLHPLIRPGSFVQIDSRQTKIGPGNWQNEFDRPIYFVELRDRYVCSWCALDGNQLFLLPYLQSREPVRQVRYPLDADVVGRVTGVVMRIA